MNCLYIYKKDSQVILGRVSYPSKIALFHWPEEMNIVAHRSKLGHVLFVISHLEIAIFQDMNIAAYICRLSQVLFGISDTKRSQLEEIAILGKVSYP